MSLAELKDEAERLSEKERRELMKWLVVLQTRGDAEFRKRLAEKIDDNDPAHWVELSDLEKRFAEQE